MPSQFEFIPSSLKVNDLGSSDDLNSISIGDMSTLGVASGSKTSTVTFETKITSGYGQTFNNTARVEGIAIDENDQNLLVSKEVTGVAVAYFQISSSS